jgi:hypothetical protein
MRIGLAEVCCRKAVAADRQLVADCCHTTSPYVQNELQGDASVPVARSRSRRTQPWTGSPFTVVYMTEVQPPEFQIADQGIAQNHKSVSQLASPVGRRVSSVKYDSVQTHESWRAHTTHLRGPSDLKTSDSAGAA